MFDCRHNCKQQLFHSHNHTYCDVILVKSNSMKSLLFFITCSFLITILLPTAYAIKINIATEECFTEKVDEPSTTLAGSFVAMLPQGILATQRQYDLTVCITHMPVCFVRVLPNTPPIPTDL